MKKMLKALGNIFTVLIFLLALCTFVISLSLYCKSKRYPDRIPDFMGYKPFVVLYNLKDTNLEAGDMVLTKVIAENEITKGDIVAIRMRDIVIVQRVVAISQSTASDTIYLTEGDNILSEQDVKVKYADIEGVCVWNMSKLGDMLISLSNPTATIIIAVVPFSFLIILIFVKDNKHKQELEELEMLKEKLKNNSKNKQINKKEVNKDEKTK